MTPDFDFNHDGKVDMQDVHLYEDIFREESGNSKSSHGNSTGGHMSGRAIIGAFLSVAYLGAFLQGLNKADTAADRKSTRLNSSH